MNWANAYIKIFCCELKTQFSVVPGQSWGDLGAPEYEDQKKAWQDYNCDNHVVDCDNQTPASGNTSIWEYEVS